MVEKQFGECGDWRCIRVPFVKSTTGILAFNVHGKMKSSHSADVGGDGVNVCSLLQQSLCSEKVHCFDSIVKGSHFSRNQVSVFGMSACFIRQFAIVLDGEGPSRSGRICPVADVR